MRIRLVSKSRGVVQPGRPARAVEGTTNLRAREDRPYALQGERIIHNDEIWLFCFDLWLDSVRFSGDGARRRQIPDADDPNIPTTAELGRPELNFEVWIALFAPAGVSQHVIDVLIPAVEKAFKDPEARRRAMNAGLVVDYLGPQETAKLLESGLATIRKVAKAAEMVR